MPEVALARRAGTRPADAHRAVAPDDDGDEAVERVERRAGRPALPAAARCSTRRPRTAAAWPACWRPSTTSRRWRARVERIRAGELEKVVLAREVDVHGPADHDPAPSLGVLREGFPGCYVLCVGALATPRSWRPPRSCWCAAKGQRASTVALAGSMRRSADPAVDDHLGEQLLRSAKDREEHAIVARRIERTLAEHAVWVTAAPEPVLARMANIQHLATPIRAQLSRPMGALDLAGLLHPTPAVGGEPAEARPRPSPRWRAWTAAGTRAPVGWTDSAQDGEFCVALRCALLRGRLARCYAGDGRGARLRPGRRAGRDRGQAGRAAAGAGGLSETSRRASGVRLAVLVDGAVQPRHLVRRLRPRQGVEFAGVQRQADLAEVSRRTG